MSSAPPFAILNKACDESVDWAVHQLAQSGMQAVRTFDLRAARPSQVKCACPYQETAQCNCQMVVLLVYKEMNPPTTMFVHGCEKKSWFSFATSPQQPPTLGLEQHIQDALSLGI